MFDEEYPGRESATLLRVMAWLWLIGGFIVAFIVYGTVHVLGDLGTATLGESVPGLGYSAGLLAGIIVAQSITVAAALLALAASAENTAEIRSTLAVMMRRR